jgi:hypothetical protein
MINKKTAPFLFNLTVSILVISSCSKKDSTPVETCFDNIKNQNEINVDCGGYCKPCPQLMTAKINGNSWEADTSRIVASYSNSGIKFQLKGNTSSTYPQISIVYLGAFSLGSHNLDPVSSITLDINSPFPAFVSSGTLTISEMDSHTNLMSGSFSFTASDGSTNYSVTEGTFMNVNYRLN